MLSISVLGPVEIRRNGQLVSVPGGKTSELLVRLALDAGALVRSDRLVEDLWAGDAVRTRRNTLQSKVAKLRRALGAPSVIVSGDDGYMLAVDPDDVDALAVVRRRSHRIRVARCRRRPGRRRAVRVDLADVPRRRASTAQVTATGSLRTGHDSKQSGRNSSRRGSRPDCSWATPRM